MSWIEELLHEEEVPKESKISDATRNIIIGFCSCILIAFLAMWAWALLKG